MKRNCLQSIFRSFLHGTLVWGAVHNNTHNGIMGLFQEGLIEVSVTPLIITAPRYEIVDFTTYTYVTTGTIIFRHPQEGLRNAFLQPLAAWVWWLMLAIVFFSSTLIWLSMRFQTKKPRIIVSIARALVMTVGVLCQQGLIQNFRKLSTRFILLTLLGFSMMIYQFYSSYITSSLLTKSPKTLNTLRQLIDSKLEVAVEDVSYNHFFFEEPPEPIFQELFEKKIKKKNYFLNVTWGLELVKKGGFAYNVDTSYGYRVVEKSFDDDEICELHELPELLYPIKITSPAVLKKSPLKEFFTVGIQRLRESGIIDYQNQQWTTKKPKCAKSNTVFKPVDIYQSFTVFMFLAMAIGLSFGVLFGEIIYYRLVEC